MRHFYTKLLYLFVLTFFAPNALAAAEEEYVRVDRFGGSSVVSVPEGTIEKTPKLSPLFTQLFESSVSPKVRTFPLISFILDTYLYNIIIKEKPGKRLELARRAAPKAPVVSGRNESMAGWLLKQFGLQ